MARKKVLTSELQKQFLMHLHCSALKLILIYINIGQNYLEKDIWDLGDEIIIYLIYT